MIGHKNKETAVIKVIPDNGLICFFGVGALVEECFDQLVTAFGRRPDFFCDNAPEKWNQSFFGIQCVSPEMLENYAEKAIVVITVKNHESIFEQLEKMGVKEIFLALYKHTYNAIGNIAKLPFDDKQLANYKSPVKSVSGKWTLVTGASRGCGRVIATEMARMGSNVIVHGRREGNTTEVDQACASFGVRTMRVGARLENKDELKNLLALIDRAVPQVDVVFNNAGISPGDTEEKPDRVGERFNKVFAVNTIAPIQICYHFIPGMIERGYGRIINVTSSIQNRPGEMAYACSKAALNKFVHDYAPGLNGTGAMMSLVDPGWLTTDMGGPDAPHPVESVLPGIILGAVLDYDVNGQWIGAQEYRGMDLERAARRAISVISCTSNSKVNSGDD